VSSRVLVVVSAVDDNEIIEFALEVARQQADHRGGRDALHVAWTAADAGKDARTASGAGRHRRAAAADERSRESRRTFGCVVLALVHEHGSSGSGGRLRLRLSGSLREGGKADERRVRVDQRRVDHAGAAASMQRQGAAARHDTGCVCVVATEVLVRAVAQRQIGSGARRILHA
jgi:hypothetical protein